MLFFSSFAWGQTPIDNSYFSNNQPTYTWDIAGSPYEIMDDIEIPLGSNLIIEPDVEVLFQGHYYIDVKGSINAIGANLHRITITSSAGNPWNGIRFDFSDNPNPAPSKLYYCDISNASKTGTTCTTPDPKSSGGAIYVESLSNLEIYECNIFNNAVLGQGGAIGLYKNSSPKIEKCNLYNNKAVKRGGALCMMIDCDPYIAGNIFEENTCTSKGGGAIGIGDLGTGQSCSPTIIGNVIINNSANKDGGGIFICNAHILYFKDNIIEGNTTQNNGGGVCIQKNSTVTLENNNIIDNDALINGGGIFIDISSPNVTINSGEISGNSAVDGGGLYASEANLTITNCNFLENTASTDGGGIYIFQSTSTIEKCTFEDNTATGNGGGVYLNDPKGTITTDPTLKLNSFKANTAYQGSALYCFRNLYSGYSNKLLNNLFAENNATDKGVVYLQGNNKYTVFNHNTISNNSCTPPAFISGVCIDYDQNKPSELKNNIIYESIVDILVIYGTYANQHPSDYYTTLIFQNHLNEKYDQNYNPPYVANGSPAFQSLATSDYHLTNASPCVDPTGSDNTATMTNTDLDGNSRIHNTKTDYGCYELGSSPPARKGRTISTNKDTQISVYPNPANSFINIEVDNGIIMSIDLFDISGQRVYSSGRLFSENNFTIPVNNLKPGYYLLSIQTPNKKINRKVVIK